MTHLRCHGVRNSDLTHSGFPPSDILWFGKHDPAVCSLLTASPVLI